MAARKFLTHTVASGLINSMMAALAVSVLAIPLRVATGKGEFRTALAYACYNGFAFVALVNL